MPTARRKNAKRRKLHGRQLQIPTSRRRATERTTVETLQERPDIRASIDRARAAAARALTPGLIRKLADERAEYQQELDRLKAATARRRKEIDEDYVEQLEKLGESYDKQRRKLEREHDERRERILRTHVEPGEA